MKIVFFDARAVPKNWNQAFLTLSQAIKTVANDKKIVIFLDELPWMATQNSKLLNVLEYQWNQYWSDDARIKLIVCGSSSSWIVNKIIKDTGGFHNRVTRKMHLSPLTLKETKIFLNQSGIKLNNSQILSLYMVTGGVPFYLTHVEKGLSATQIIENLAFRKNSFLLEEFQNLYASLFNESEDYIAILELISKAHYGISQVDLFAKLNKSLRGKRGLEILNDLIASDFIISFKSHFNKKRGIYYKIIDEYTLFYFQWIQPIKDMLQERSLETGNWQETQNSVEWSVWSGYAFEAVCYKHISQIRKCLNISANAVADTWRYVPIKKEENQGAQIDLLFDRKDDAITLCEIKFSNKPYVLSKKFSQDLRRKADVLQAQTGTHKQLFWVLISANGVKNNFYAEDFLSGIVTLEDLFK